MDNLPTPLLLNVVDLLDIYDVAALAASCARIHDILWSAEAGDALAIMRASTLCYRDHKNIAQRNKVALEIAALLNVWISCSDFSYYRGVWVTALALGHAKWATRCMAKVSSNRETLSTPAEYMVEKEVTMQQAIGRSLRIRELEDTNLVVSLVGRLVPEDYVTVECAQFEEFQAAREGNLSLLQCLLYAKVARCHHEKNCLPQTLLRHTDVQEAVRGAIEGEELATLGFVNSLFPILQFVDILVWFEVADTENTLYCDPPPQSPLWFAAAVIDKQYTFSTMQLENLVVHLIKNDRVFRITLWETICEKSADDLHAILLMRYMEQSMPLYRRAVLQLLHTQPHRLNVVNKSLKPLHKVFI